MSHGSNIIGDSEIGRATFPSVRGIVKKKFTPLGNFLKKGAEKVKKAKQLLSDPTKIQYFILFGKFGSDARQYSEGEFKEYIEGSGVEDILVKCIQTNIAGFHIGQFFDKRKKSKNTYSASKKIIPTGNDTL